MTTAVKGAIGAIVLHRDDDVAVLLRPAGGGESIVADGALGNLVVRVNACLPLGHKIALRDLVAGAEIRKHGEVIGRLTTSVAAGDHVHVHNLASLRGR